MRRIIPAAAAALLTTLWLAGAALAADLPSHRTPQGRAPSARPAAFPAASAAEFRPLGARLAAAAGVVNGHVYTYGGSPAEGSYVYGEAYDYATRAWTWDATSAGSDGAYSLGRLAAADQEGYLEVVSANEPWTMRRYSVSWADPGPTTFDFRAGAVPTTVVRGGPWPDWTQVESELFGSDALSGILAESYISGSNDVVVGNSYALSGTYPWGAVYFWSDQGVEHYPGATVTAGAQNAQSVNVAQDGAQRISVTAPYWASGKPGAAVTVRHWNFPAGWNLQFSGWPDAPTGSEKGYGTAVASGADSFNRTFTIPKTAPVGYSYHLKTDHADGLLLLRTPYQVCTMKPSKAAVRKGTTIRVSGVVPIAKHWGKTKGTPKTVTLYAHKGTAKVPTRWNPKSQGWVKVCTAKTNGLGAYTTKSFKPARTQTLVVRYPGDAWYWDAYTSTAKVTVK